jgi:hypothetical protein
MLSVTVVLTCMPCAHAGSFFNGYRINQQHKDDINSLLSATGHSHDWETGITSTSGEPHLNQAQSSGSELNEDYNSPQAGISGCQTRTLNHHAESRSCLITKQYTKLYNVVLLNADRL